MLFSHCWFDSFGKRVENPTPSGVVGSPTPGVIVPSASAPPAPLVSDFDPPPLARVPPPGSPITPVQAPTAIAPARTVNDTPRNGSIERMPSPRG
jgi:hypothetical protein